ncbi:unnamed protein product [Pleuronectes platessa]|uniref:Uncharacterized protein n=1 Tax=Pleuronectes platessa TaxID=8262 RepID=A0A9N7UVA2_PLEPL|nr:unnamed protein product [Pleuronectes platessa]
MALSDSKLSGIPNHFSELFTQSALFIDPSLQLSVTQTHLSVNTRGWSSIVDGHCGVHLLLSLIPSTGPVCLEDPEACRRLRAIRTKTSRHKTSFFPAAVGLINKARDPHLTRTFIPPPHLKDVVN